MSNVKLVWATPDSDKLLAYIARVSNPLQQDKSVGGLFKYMVKEGHTSPFTMANVCMEINVPRDISRQIMRHWSMMLHELDVQEFSQRYADVSLLPEAQLRECRMQDTTNRQNSLPCTDPDIAEWWRAAQEETVEHETEKYQKALALGIAKEQARAVLPEGLTPSRFYLNGNYRSWIFFLTWRLHGTAQKEVRDVADEALVILREVAPLTMETFFPVNAPTPEEVCQAAYLDYCHGKFGVMSYSTWQSVWTAARAA